MGTKISCSLYFEAYLLSSVESPIVIAFAIAQNIREKIQALAISCQYPGIGGLPAEVIKVSVGVASTVPDIEVKPTILMEIVEQALYQAKREGRNRVVVAQK